MITPTIVWTVELQRAVIALSCTTYEHASTSIPERAREMTWLRPGAHLSGMQLDCVAMLRSRMYQDTPEELAFNAAWSDAWNAAHPEPEYVGGNVDPACVPRPGRHGDHGPAAAEIARPTQAEAVAYVLNLEKSWGLAPAQCAATDGLENGAPVVRVLTYVTGGTPQNDWSVWFEPDGSIYGEC